MLSFIIACIFLSVGLTTGLILYPLISRRMLIQNRLEKITDDRVGKPSLIKEQTPLQEFLGRLGTQLPLKREQQTKYTAMLQAAGFSRRTTPIFLGSKLLLALALPGLFALSYALPRGVLMSSNSLLILPALAIIGFLAPSYWLIRRVDARKREIFHTLPDLLDLLTVCVEAGLGLDAALVKTTENPQFKGNPLAEEVKVVSREIRAGKPRIDAFKDMAERTMVEDVRAFVAMLIQTERFGTSLSLALRVHADSLRVKRRQIAEEAAAKTAVKMLFPLAFFIFPALMLIIIGPAFFRISQIFK